jgi:VWFA-related protein
VLFAILLTCSTGSLAAQQEPTFSTDVNVVTVLATVRNKQGQVVRDLTKDDFALEEDGRPQTIRYFAQETDLPLTLGLVVDTSLSQERVLDEERTASYRFLDKVLREDRDLAFLIHFEEEAELLQDLTASREKLQAALALLRTPSPPPRTRVNMPFPWPGMPGGGGVGGSRGGTALHDALYLASDELMKSQPGRKALVVLSDGVDNASKVSLELAIESAQRSDTLVYTILFADRGDYGFQGGFGGIGGIGRQRGRQRFPQQLAPDGSGVLQRIAKQTGGRYFEVSRGQGIDQIYSAIEEELRTQYNLGYTPDRQGADAGYHKIRLTVRKKDRIVQTRDGYYSN